jgi:competence protein ComEC
VSLPWLLALTACGLSFGPPALWALLPFAATGWVLGERPSWPVLTSAPGLVQTEAVVTRASRRQADRQRSLVQTTTAPAWLAEPLDAPHRQRGDRLLVRGWYFPPRQQDPSAKSPFLGTLSSRTGQVDWQGVESSWCVLLPRWIDGVHRALLDGWLARLSPTARGLCAALLLGRSDQLPPSLKARLQATGSYHFVAVSGLHVALLGGVVLQVLRSLFPRRSWAAWLALLVVLCYVLLSGARPPVLRAFVLFAAYLWKQSRRRPAPVAPTLAFALLLVTALDPRSLTQVGLQLSFLAVFAIQISSRYRLATSPRGSGRGIQLWKPVQRSLTISLAATLATAPLTAFHFGSVAPWSPLSSLVLAPLILTLLIVAAGLALLAPLAPQLVSAATVPLEAWVCGIDLCLRQLDRLPATPWHLPETSRLWAISLLLALFPLHARRPLWSLPLVLASLASLHSIGRFQPPYRLTAFNVGHGQAIVLRDPTRQQLMDAGGHGANEQRQSEVELACAEPALEALWISHLDSDHAGFAHRLCQPRPGLRLFLPTSQRARFRDAATAVVHQLRLLSSAAGRRAAQFVVAGHGHGFVQALWPPPGRQFLSENEGSLVLQAELGRRRVLLPGDLSGVPLWELSEQVATMDVLVLPHHGNADGNLPALLRATRPWVALASRGNELPAETRAQLREAGIPWMSTALDGRIQLHWSNSRTSSIGILRSNLSP